MTTTVTSNPRVALTDLEDHGAFARRHIGTDDDERTALLDVVGAPDLDAFLDRVVPASIRTTTPLPLAGGRTESETLEMARRLAARNDVFTSLIGMGYHGTIVPPVLQRSILENPAWYTAYTPYQPEISQGRLEALLNFQTMIADLAGLDVANASLLDEGTAAAEAMTLAQRASKHRGRAFFVDAQCHPQTIAVLRTRAEPIGIELLIGDPGTEFDGARCFGAIVQYPSTFGSVRDLRPIAATVHEAGALLAVAADPLALVLLAAPGHQGADIVVGSTQRFGVPMGFGGPHAAYLVTRESFARSLPGRLVGVSTDSGGRPALRLALQTREQHIRREKATSNICTAQVLLAVMAGMYAVWHGPDGLRRIAQRVHRLTSVLAAALDAAGMRPVNDSWFDTLTVRVADSAVVASRARDRRINVRVVDSMTVAVSFDETTTVAVVADVLGAFGVTTTLDALYAHDATAADGIPQDSRRGDEILTHPVFHRYHAEHEMLRYLRRLADRDLALDRTMIPLGSCTMKLNATAEMMPITWPEFANMHPFAPAEQTAGYRALIGELEAMLLACTGYDAVSLQPNAGSQGELSGPLAIRAYHRSRGDLDRTICLIPSSAHGTNAASAVMAGLQVVVVACDSDGNVDLDDLREKATTHAGDLAALMVTYPSTHGVFEPAITEVCSIVHDHGGQVYVDGANLNALVGLAAPGRFGADVSHLNLHKTFCIPHGGGGPGVGPVVARAHLAPFLPGHPLEPVAEGGVGPVAAAPWGSAGILVISWAYITLMGGDGLRAATANAILNANYIARRLHEHFPVLYRGEHGDVAHECILDLRPITKTTGVTVDDVAKRLIDYGFHAPTMSFPVAGTLMVEPTESESKRELDRFCDAMIAIRAEIDRVAGGEWPTDDNPLHHAPHTAEDIAGEWAHPYSRDEAVFPTPLLRTQKYFPPVGRIDSAYGDRHLVCSCPPLEDY